MNKQHYITMQYVFIGLFVAFFVYAVSWRCEPTLLGALYCWPKVVGISVWFVVSMLLLKVTYTKLSKSSDTREAVIFWVVNILILCLYTAAFAFLFVLNYL